MATLDQLVTALKNADAAGDTVAARVLAGEIRRMQTTSADVPPSSPPAVSGTVQPVKQGDTTDLFSSLMAAGRGAVDTVSFGADDEIGAGLRTGFGFLGDYGKDVAESRALKAKAAEEHPIAFGAGQVAGVLPTLAIPGMGIAKAAKLSAKAGKGAAIGGVQGAAYGAGSAEGDISERLPGALETGLVGLGTGAAVPLVGNVIGKAAGRKVGAAAVPTVAERKAGAQTLYDQADQIGVTVAPNSFGKMTNDLVTKLTREGIDKDIQPKAFAAAQKIIKAANTGIAPTLQDMDIFRQVASNIARDGMAGANERRLAGKIIGHIDDFMDNLQPADVLSGDASRAVPLITEARKLWKIKAKGEIVGRAIEDAANAASGVENGLRTEFRKLLKSGKYKWTPDETKALQKVVRGGAKENLLRFLGTFGYSMDQARSFLGAVIGGGVGAAALGPVGAVALPVLGTAAKAAAKKLTEGNARRASQTVLNAGVRPFDQAAFTKAGQRSARFLDPFARGVVVPSYDRSRR